MDKAVESRACSAENFHPESPGHVPGSPGHLPCSSHVSHVWSCLRSCLRHVRAVSRSLVMWQLFMYPSCHVLSMSCAGQVKYSTPSCFGQVVVISRSSIVVMSLSDSVMFHSHVTCPRHTTARSSSCACLGHVLVVSWSCPGQCYVVMPRIML